MSDFNEWWHETGSGVTVSQGADHEEHAKRIADMSWRAALEDAANKFDGTTPYNPMYADGYANCFDIASELRYMAAETPMKTLEDAALVGEVKPVAWCLRYNDPRCGPIHSNPSMCKPELEAMECVTSGRVSVENLFTAEAIAQAVLAERERAAKLLDQTDLSKLPDEWKVFLAQLLNAYAKAIREGKK